jgi:DAACS family dicarboxylate/amino acid:cation (Na+ or H+) symporter
MSHEASGKGLPLHTKILIGFIVGTVAGSLSYAYAQDSAVVAGVIKYLTDPVGQIFLRLLFMLVIPLVFSALVMGVAEMGDIRALGRVGWRTLAYTLVVSGIAVVIGLVMVNLFQPGAGIDDAMRAQLLAGASERAASVTSTATTMPTGIQMLINIVPKNAIEAAANNDMMGIMFFALMIGIGLVLTQTPATARFKEAVQGLFDIAMKLISIVIRLAPYAVACLMYTLTAKLGWGVLQQLGSYVLVVVGALAIHMFVTYSLLVKFLARMSPLAFFKAIEESMITAFSTASSTATLPTALRNAEQNLKLPPTIARFVLTIGASANQNGTALFEGVTVLFLAQFFGIELTLGQQVAVMGVCILGGIGTAGVPAGSIPVVALILGMVGVPVEGIALILGVDRFLDMCRTTLNVTGDLVAATVIAANSADVAPGTVSIPDASDPAPGTAA